MELYHNPQCSKSRKAIELVPQETKIIEYLKTPLSVDELRELCMRLQVRPEKIVRKNESQYKELVHSKGVPDDETVLAWMSEHPTIMQRPIFVKGNNAIIARPPEKILELL